MVQPRKGIHAMTPPRNISDSQDESISDSEDEVIDKSDSNLGLEEDFVDTSRTFTRERFEKSHSIQPSHRRSIRLESSSITPASNKQIFWTFSLVAILIAAGIVFFFTTPKEKICSFKRLETRYMSENESLWSRLKIGVGLILNKRTEKPAVYLFVHHGGQRAFQLIREIAEECSECFGKKIVKLESDDFAPAPSMGNDYGHAIQKYKNKINEGNVILIANLNDIPAKAARALHTICDTYSPIAKNVVIFLALTIEPNKIGSGNAIAEETLIELWGSNLGRNELDPLITRVTDEVIILQS